MSLDPGYGNTGSCTSSITFINGEKGILLHLFKTRQHGPQVAAWCPVGQGMGTDAKGPGPVGQGSKGCIIRLPVRFLGGIWKQFSQPVTHRFHFRFLAHGLIGSPALVLHC